MERMKFGLAFANIGPFIEPDEAIRLAQAAEGAGFESIWAVDHVVVPAGYQSKYPYDPSGQLPSGEATVFPDPLIWLAYVAAHTSTLRLGTGILIVAQRNPLVLAKELATLDYLSGGRMILGAGIGWLAEEFQALGIPFSGRGPRTEEAIAAMRALWSQEQATFEGNTASFRHCFLRPQPRAGTIPVHVGGHSEGGRSTSWPHRRRVFPLRGQRGRIAPLFDVVRRSAGGGGEGSGRHRAHRSMQQHWRRSGPGRRETPSTAGRHSHRDSRSLVRGRPCTVAATLWRGRDRVALNCDFDHRRRCPFRQGPVRMP